MIDDVTDIRADDEYGGNKYHIVGKLENLKVALEIDISTGDEITPKELNFDKLKIICYNKKHKLRVYLGFTNPSGKGQLKYIDCLHESEII